MDIATLRLSDKSKSMFSRAVDLNSLVKKFSKSKRKIKISLKGLKDIYIFTKYVVDNNCSRDCEFKPSANKEIDFSQGYVETVEASPYSVQLLVFKKKPPEPEVLPAGTAVGENQTASAQTEVKPQVKPEIKPEIKSEVKPEAKPALTPETKPEIKTIKEEKSADGK